MVEQCGPRRRSSPGWRALTGIAAAVLSAVLAGCSGGSGDGANATCPTPNPAPPAETALLPAGLSFDKIGTVTHVENTADHVTVRAVAAKPLDELTVLIQDAVTAAGYRPAGMDSEDDEAEVFFNSGSLAAGQATVRRGGCAGQWNIDLVLITPKTTAPPATPGTT